MIGMIVTGITVPLVSMFTKQSHPDQVEAVWTARKISAEDARKARTFNIWPATVKGRVFLCLMLVGLLLFLTSLTLGRYPAQEGYSIGRTRMQRFRADGLARCRPKTFRRELPSSRGGPCWTT